MKKTEPQISNHEILTDDIVPGVSGAPDSAPCACNAAGGPLSELRVVIIDDDRPSIDVLADALGACAGVKIVGTARTLREGRTLIESKRPDLVFLDIELPDGSGLDLFSAGKEYPGTRFVFYTVYSKYFHEAFRLRAYDFLLKPFEPNEVRLILERCRLEEGKPGVTANEVAGCLPQRGEGQPISISIMTGEKLIVPPSAILFFKYDSDRKIWEAVMTNLQRHILKRHTTAELILSYGSDFVRTHKSYIINISYLAMLVGNECRLLPPFNDIEEIKISKNFRRALLDRFYDL